MDQYHDFKECVGLVTTSLGLHYKAGAWGMKNYHNTEHYQKGCFTDSFTEKHLLHFGFGYAETQPNFQNFVCKKYEELEEDRFTQADFDKVNKLKGLLTPSGANKFVCETKSCYHRWQNGKCEKIRQEN